MRFLIPFLALVEVAGALPNPGTPVPGASPRPLLTPPQPPTLKVPAAATEAPNGPNAGKPAAPPINQRPAAPPAPSVVPAPYPFERYAELIDHSPFALATPTAAPSAPTTPTFDGWKLKVLTWYKDEETGENKSYVVVKTGDARDQIKFYGHDVVHGGAGDGAFLESINDSELFGKSTVMVKKGSESGKIEFDQADVAGPVNTQVPMQPVHPGQPGQPQPYNPRMNSPNIPARPRIPASSPGPAPIIPRPAYQAPNNSPVPPGQPEPRRRIRVIGNP